MFLRLFTLAPVIDTTLRCAAGGMAGFFEEGFTGLGTMRGNHKTTVFAYRTDPVERIDMAGKAFVRIMNACQVIAGTVLASCQTVP